MLKTINLAAWVVASLSATAAATRQFVMYTPGGDDTAVERLDQILYPGTVAAHVHQFFGSNGLSSDMTYDSLQNADCTTVGAADGSGNADDHSVYWHPALYAEAADGSGMTRIPTNGHKLYYRDVGNAADRKNEPFDFPKGFRMIAGDQLLRAPNSDSQKQSIVQWYCHGPEQIGQDGGFPSGVTDCPQYPWFAGSIHFPHCWNGEDFDQSNPYAHVSYPDGDVQGGPCPSSHPIRIPHIFVENFFDVSKVSIKPGTFVLSQGDNTGYGWHMDFFNGWASGAIERTIASCPDNYYGNEDVGLCSGLKRGSKTANCKLSVTYDENVDTPGRCLPGCNPIQSTNPAVKMSVASLGQAIDDCSAAGAAGNTTDYYSERPAPQKKPSSDYDRPSSSATRKWRGHNVDNTLGLPVPTAVETALALLSNVVTEVQSEIVYETAWVTVTAGAEDAHGYKPKRHAHVRKHLGHAHHIGA